MIEQYSRTDRTHLLPGSEPEPTQEARNGQNTRSFVPLIRVSSFGVVLGLAGLGTSWRIAHRIWGMPAVIGESLILAATLLWFVLLVLYVTKWIFRREYALQEMNDPIQSFFIGLIGVTTSLIAVAILPYSRAIAIVLFVVGVLLTLGFAVWRTGLLWQGGRDLKTNTPLLYLPTVAGSFITAIAASSLGFRDWGQLAFGAGLFSWLAIESVSLHRLYTAAPLPEALRPTLGIQLAPPTVGAVAYLSVTDGPPGLVAYALLGYGLLQMLILLRLLPWITRQPFVPSYWAFSFGVTALASTSLRMTERGAVGAVKLLAVPLFFVANIIIAILTTKTIDFLLRNRFSPSERTPKTADGRISLSLK